MSRHSHRAAVLLLLHQQAMYGALTPPRLEAIAPHLLAPPPPWYIRAWLWLRDRYQLVGWEAP
jgi:hypothetical protein